MFDASRVDILGVQVHAQPFDMAIQTLLDWAQEQDGRRYVCTCPVFTVMACQEDSAARQAVNGADMATADGMPVVWVQRWWGYRGAERVYGPDVLRALCEKSAGTGIRHFFWGGLPGTVEQLGTALKTRYPHLEIAGVFAPPVGPLESEPLPEMVERLNSADPQIVWVGLGSPKQDQWMALYRPALNAPLLIGVGAAFDFVAGTKRQAPIWMQRSGLEWLFRLIQEPGRLWKRYLLYNPRFVWGILRQTWRRSHRV
jgi:N-acetylglucosaminyldiphosphoundecaprenol N-acetyl-beta-D-mannosaminyltransferase